ncbi:2236_t:CDS:2 [Cetraspora pellucida]|uniref:2236_t:CDS:1 n=1 Tax=Cetraspora pellucida TaxID=1433469 RepID=A0A9N9ECV3_9GLOM|nr:2236_t:CDS:2 [Cetraspora pellucida]
MEKQERESNLTKARRPRVKNDSRVATVPPPSFLRNKTTSGSNRPRVARINTSSLSDKEKARSDDGFFSDSDKDSSQSNKSANSNISVQSSMSFLNKTPSIISDAIIRVRPKSSLGTSSEKSHIDLANRQSQQADEARKNRKIADLEISIKSLMTINAELDETNKKQAAEIIELKRMLKVNDSFMSEVYAVDDDELSTPLTETDLAEIEKDNDVRFKRICLLIDELLRDAQEALECSAKAIGTKVLPNAQLGLSTVNNTSCNESDTPNEDFLNESVGHYDEILTQSSHHSNTSIESKNLEVKLEELENKSISTISSKRSKKSKTRSNIDTLISTNPKLKIKTSMNQKQNIVGPKLKSQHSRDPKLKNSPDTPTSVDPELKNSKSLICENGERVQEVIKELLILAKQDTAKQDTVNNKKLTPQPFERKGLGLLLSIQDGQNGIIPHNTYNTYNTVTNNNVDTSPTSPTITLLYELQELLGIGDAESSKFTNEYRKSCPVISSSRIHFQIDAPNEDSIVDERDGSRAQLNNSTDRARVVRRRSSPNFRTPSSPMNKSDDAFNTSRAKSNVDSNSHPHGSDVVKPSLWASSLGFLTPWKLE